MPIYVTRSRKEAYEMENKRMYQGYWTTVEERPEMPATRGSGSLWIVRWGRRKVER